MDFSKLLRQFITHSMALVFGFTMAFGGIRVLSTQAQPVSAVLPPVSETIALANNRATTESFVAAAVERTGSAVVRIDTETVVTRRRDPMFNDPFFRDFFDTQVEPNLPSEQTVRGQGSGFIVNSNGIIMTNAHVVSKATKVTVTLRDGRSFAGVVKGTDEITDLAVVQIAPQGTQLPVAPLGDSSQVRVGDWAIAVGNPIGLDNTVTLGIVSTLDRASSQVGIPDKRIDFIQTDAAINPGNSGGPLLNASGEVIGINTAIRADANGIGFAIPINRAKSLQNILASGQEVPHPYIGVKMITITPELARENNQNPNSPIVLPEVNGVLVLEVIPNTPAAKAGIRTGDVITKVNNQPISDGGELQSMVEAAGVNQTLQLTIQRGNSPIQVNVQTAQLRSNS